MLITIFTPTYNRSYTLKKLYDSLRQQTEQNFEWIIIDDGSSDDTEELVENLKRENKIPITYEKQKNGGKHRAINRGLKLAAGEFFFIVDSDDFLTNDAIEKINIGCIEGADLKECCGLIFNNIYPDKTCVGGKPSIDRLYCNLFEFRFKYKIRGDKAEVYKTEIIRNFLFPEISNELFCPEALVMHRIAKRYKMLYINEGIYVCEYLPDGLSAKIVKIRMKSPQYSTLYYKELFYYDIPMKQKIKASINYWRFAFCLPRGISVSHIPLWTIIFIPLSYLMYFKDKQG